MAKKHKRQLIDLDTYNDRPQQYTDGSVGFHLPHDCPAYAKVFRLYDQGAGGALKGHTIELSAFLLGVKVLVRIGRQPSSIKVFVQEDDGKPIKVYEAELEDT